ncbi:hypothetical protein ABIF68_010123 [Bradyrhizobium japonicum]|jgi:hypothetical protein
MIDEPVDRPQQAATSSIVTHKLRDPPLAHDVLDG